MVPHLCALYSAFAYLTASWGYVSAVFRRAELPEARRKTWRAVLSTGLFAHICFVYSTHRYSAYGGDSLPPAMNVSPAQLPALISLLSCLLIGLFLVLERRERLSALGALVAPLAFFLLLASAVLFHLEQAGSHAPMVHGFLVSLHLTAMIVAYAFFLFAVCVSAAFLLQERNLKAKRGALSDVVFPSIALLDRMTRLFVGAGFAMLVLAVSVGVIIAVMSSAGGSQLTGRLLWIAPVFLVYGDVVVLAFVRGVRGRRVAWMTVFGLAWVLLSFFGGRLGGGEFHV